MATRNKFNTARVAALGVCKNFFRFEIQKPHAYRAVSQNSFQVTAPAAPAKILLRVQRYHRVSALPCAFTPGIPAESNSVAKCPHPIELVQHTARGCDPCRGSIGIVVDTHRNPRAVRCQRALQGSAKIESFNLLQIWRLFDNSVANNSRKTYSYRVQ